MPQWRQCMQWKQCKQCKPTKVVGVTGDVFAPHFHLSSPLTCTLWVTSSATLAHFLAATWEIIFHVGGWATILRHNIASSLASAVVVFGFWVLALDLLISNIAGFWRGKKPPGSAGLKPTNGCSDRGLSIDLSNKKNSHTFNLFEVPVC